MGNNGISHILIGIFIGAFLALVNSYLLYLTVVKTLNFEKKKAKIIISVIYFIKFFLLFGVFFALVKFTKINFLAVAITLGVITLFTPYKLFIKNAKTEK